MDVIDLNYKVSNQFNSFENNQYNMAIGGRDFNSGGSSLIHATIIDKLNDANNNSATKSKIITPIN